jgi:hypothetical protein
MPRLAAALVCALALAAASAAPAWAGDETADTGTLAASIAAPWPALQRENGSLINRLDGATAFGEAMMGYGLLQEGVRTDSRALQHAGIDAITYAATRGGRSADSVFEELAIAAAYNYARDRLTGDDTDPGDVAAVQDFHRQRARWEAFLERVPPIGDLYRTEPSERFTNKYIVEAIAILELDRTGLRSSSPTAILGGGRAKALSRARWLLLERIPRMLSAQRMDAGGVTTALLSDMPDAPLAYHALSTAMYAHATELAGLRDNATVRRTLAWAVNASWVLAAPDGDLAYWGRSHQQGWALAATAYAADVARRTVLGPSADRYRSLVTRSLERLDLEHPRTADGMLIVPAMRDGVKEAEPGVDGNAGMPSSGGLALVFLEWLLDTPPEPAAAPAALLSDDDVVARLGREEAHFAVVRRGARWYAVRRSESDDHAGDFRFDFGLIALKVRRDGRWRDLVRQRPKLIKLGDGIGPRLVAGSARYRPFGRKLSVARDGTVTIEGGFRTTGGRVVRNGVRFKYIPLSCGGVGLRWPVRKGDVYAFSTFEPSRPTPAATSRTITSSTARLFFSTRASISRGRPYSSAYDADLTRLTARLKTTSTTPVSIAICPPL